MKWNNAASLASLEDPSYVELALSEYKSATNLTDQFAALAALSQNPGKTRDDVLADFYNKWQGDYLVWFLISHKLLPSCLHTEIYLASFLRLLINGSSFNRHPTFPAMWRMWRSFWITHLLICAIQTRQVDSQSILQLSFSDPCLTNNDHSGLLAYWRILRFTSELPCQRWIRLQVLGWHCCPVRQNQSSGLAPKTKPVCYLLLTINKPLRLAILVSESRLLLVCYLPFRGGSATMKPDKLWPR